MNETKQYCVKIKSYGEHLCFYYAISELHAKYCHLARHPEFIGLDNIVSIEEHPPHPSFQFKMDKPTETKVGELNE